MYQCVNRSVPRVNFSQLIMIMMVNRSVKNTLLRTMQPIIDGRKGVLSLSFGFYLYKQVKQRRQITVTKKEKGLTPKYGFLKSINQLAEMYCLRPFSRKIKMTTYYLYFYLSCNKCTVFWKMGHIH